MNDGRCSEPGCIHAGTYSEGFKRLLCDWHMLELFERDLGIEQRLQPALPL